MSLTKWLDAHAKYPDSSLADLYDPTTMPYDLFGGSPPERPFCDASLRLLHQDDRIGVRRQTPRDVHSLPNNNKG
ncbi:MAG: type IIL restriction-modification enzyme MmeI [Sodaliphilus pleomorphus]|nr:type IIL restriction-modification enzyme MmeI [Sodaliphilus pleomorphus]MDY2831963.1 type IIL restriction-modification enzyme MmeI [Sodaliphilus pleomorphus]MDY6253021.1 type IIL restriction-modification enzyme MmeI [Bacteroidales bacterium]MDY6259764.1 type IIL restriction-modification enzyme MmeI [Bacteroidales bacterium]